MFRSYSNKCIAKKHVLNEITNILYSLDMS